MSIKSLKHSISSLRLAKKATSAIFKDSIFSSLVTEYLDSETPSNPFMHSNINHSSKSIYYDTIKKLIEDKKSTELEIKAIALKFQKILSLEIQQDTIQRMLNGQYADHMTNTGGTYDIIPISFECPRCKKEFPTFNLEQTFKANINLLPTLSTVWHPHRLTKNLKTIGTLINNPFEPNNNNKADYYTPLNLLVAYNGNHSANVALYENNSFITNAYVYRMNNWFDNIFFNPSTNAFYHIKCNQKVTPEKIFHENIGYIYEIARLLYQNDISFTITEIEKASNLVQKDVQESDF